MEGESREPVEQTTELEQPKFLRVEFDGEHKIFVKECTECGQTFRTSVPKKFFKNPNDASTTLRVNGGGLLDGYEAIQADVVAENIARKTCLDPSRHPGNESES